MLKAHLVYKKTCECLDSQIQIFQQAYIQTIYKRNDKYKLYLNMQTTLSHNLITTQQ